MADKLFTDEEFNELVQTLNGITTHIPENLGPYIWDTYKKVTGSNENRPCYCGSSANLWRKAVDANREYVKKNSDKYNAK